MAAGTARQAMDVESQMKRDVQTACATDLRFRAVRFTHADVVQQTPSMSIEASEIWPDEEELLIARLFADHPPMYDIDHATATTPRIFKFVLRGTSQTARFLSCVRELHSAKSAAPSA